MISVGETLFIIKKKYIYITRLKYYSDKLLKKITRFYFKIFIYDLICFMFQKKNNKGKIKKLHSWKDNY